MVKPRSKFIEYRYIIGVTAAVILSSIILGILVVQPLYTSLKKTNQDLAIKKEVLAKLESNLTTLKQLESKKVEIENKNSKVLAALPTDKDVPRLFTQFESIANAAGLNIKTIVENAGTSQNTEPAEATKNLINPLSYQVSGTATSYSALKKALAKIEDGLRVVSIEKVDIQGGQDALLNVNLTVITYLRGQ